MIAFGRMSGIRVSATEESVKVYNSWTILGNRFRVGMSTYVVCECRCGSIHVVERGSVARGMSSGCGCERSVAAADRAIKHGMSYSGEYRSWAAAKNRCTNINSPKHPNYGGRGITMCDRWLESFENFIADMGPRPSPQHSIDRFPDNDGPYSPENCRWATPLEQSMNRRASLKLTVDGESVTVSQLAAEHGVTAKAIYKRLSKGWVATRGPNLAK